MTRFKRCLNCSKKSLMSIHFVDKCLILFMLILLSQSAISLFHKGVTSKESGDIDIIIRTSSAAIFGYFISGNFMRRPPVPNKKVTPDLSKADAETHSVKDEPEKEYTSNKLQVIIASFIGIFCLVVLIIQRDISWTYTLSPNNSSTTATIAQFRDFVSGCVGFLIGTPTHRSS